MPRFTIFCIIFLFLVNPLQAATMPPYERQQALTSNLSVPTAVAVDASQNIYVVEASTNRLLMYNSFGEHLKTLDGLNEPISVAVDANGKILIGNKAGGNVEVYTSDLTLQFKLGLGDGEFMQPSSIGIAENGNMYVVDSDADMISVYSSDGRYDFSFGTPGTGNGEFHFPVAIAIDHVAQELIISDLQLFDSTEDLSNGARIQVFNLNGSFKRSFAVQGVGDGKLSKPLGLVVDDEGRIYISDILQDMVQVFDGNGIFLGKISDPENPIKTPLGLALSDKQQLFVASLAAAKIEVFGNVGLKAALTPSSPPSSAQGSGSSASNGPTTSPSGISSDPDPETVIPEPATLLLVASGLLGILAFGRKKQKR